MDLSLRVAAATFLFLLTAGAGAQTAINPVSPSIHGPILDSESVTLEGNVHRLARAEYDRGVLAPESRLDRMVLLLTPGPAREEALARLLESQQEPGSALYHQWLTPEEFGDRFGAAPEDVAAVSAWLASRGFQVEPAAAGRRLIIFSGTAMQVAETFHTEIHRFEVPDETLAGGHATGGVHIANTQDPQIPRAIAPVVAGLLSLHDFRRQAAVSSRRAARVEGELPVQAATRAEARPENTQGGSHYLLPADYAILYNLAPLYAAGVRGSGVSIAVVGRSNVLLSDVAAFRSFAGLAANQPTVVLDGANPGTSNADELDEATLDVEWSGAVAPSAHVTLVTARSTATTDGVDLSAQYIVNHKIASIMTTSFGNCEAYMGSGEMTFYRNLRQQAASEGITSLVSSGDSGAAGCNGGSASAGSGQGVNGLCSSPDSTCVGGTEFNEGAGTYWSANNGAGDASALGYIPEEVWNESASTGGSGLWSSGGGISIAYPQPTWQIGVPGASSNGMRAVPDVSLTAAGHDGYLVCISGSWYVIAGTSASAPSFSGIVALIESHLLALKVPAAQGNINPTLYSLLTAQEMPFHATHTGSNSVPGVNGYAAGGAAYNLATGLGSVDGKALAESWPASVAKPAPSLALKGAPASISLARGHSITLQLSTTTGGSYSGPIALTITGMPSGVTAVWVNSKFTPSSSTSTTLSTVTLTAAKTAVLATASLQITASGDGLASHLASSLKIAAQ